MPVTTETNVPPPPDHLDLNHNLLGGKWFVDLMPAKMKSITQRTGEWVY